MDQAGKKSQPSGWMWLIAGVFFVLALIAISTIWWAARGDACELATKLSDKAGSCFEFWLNRYQTLIGGVLALIAGLLAYIGIMQQMAQDRLIASREYDEARQLFGHYAGRFCTFINASLDLSSGTKEEYSDAINAEPRIVAAMAASAYKIFEETVEQIISIKPRMLASDQVLADRVIAKVTQIKSACDWMAADGNATGGLARDCLTRIKLVGDSLLKECREQGFWTVETGHSNPTH